jgi:hypothetical protein
MMRNKADKLIVGCLFVLLMGCQHNQEPKSMQMVAHLKEHEVLNVTDGLTAEYENIKKTQYEKYLLNEVQKCTKKLGNNFTLLFAVSL